MVLSFSDRSCLTARCGMAGLLSWHVAAALRPDRRGGVAVGPAVGSGAGDARSHLPDAGPAAGARPTGRHPQAARVDVRALRGARVAVLLVEGLPAAGEDGGAPAGASDVDL